VKIHLDYESRSHIDLTEVGAHRYGVDPSTEILMAGVSRDGDSRVYLWINPKFRTPDYMGENAEAEQLLKEATEIASHNVSFEQALTWGTHQRQAASPFTTEPNLSVWRCSAAVARKAGLPYSLEKLCETLQVRDSKDRAGKALIQFFCIPDAETGKFNEPRDHPEKWAAFCEYCRQDVRAETECGQKLKPFELTGSALATFQFDLRMNQLGVPVNVAAARNAQKIIDEVQGGVAEEFRRLTGYNVTQRAKVLAWFNNNNNKLGLNLPNTQAATIDKKLEELKTVLSDPLEDAETIARATEAYRILEMYQAVSYAAVKKIQTMLDCACPDGRVRGCHMYYGAGTGRWSSKLLQVQNFRKPDKAMKSFMDHAYLAIGKGISAGMMEQIYGAPLEVLANCIRNFIHHPNHEIIDGDYNAIEGRIACWVAGQTDILEAWRRGEDLYKRAAAFVEGKAESEIQNPSPERDFGKVVELACQFGLGVDGFIRTCAKFGIECDEDKAHRSVHEYYRPTHDKIVTRWWLHDNWMRDAIAYPTTQQGPWTFKRVSGFNYLLLRLPSGRSLAFPDPKIERREPNAKERAEMAEGKVYPDKRFLEITYWGQLPMSATWGRVKLHGSLGFQNEVQAIAADFMAHGAITAESRGMPPFMLVHDQGVTLRNKSQTAEMFAAALADLPSWATGFPMKVEAKIHPWFRK
jgi:DNA polymerase